MKNLSQFLVMEILSGLWRPGIISTKPKFHKMFTNDRHVRMVDSEIKALFKLNCYSLRPNISLEK